MRIIGSDDLLSTYMYTRCNVLHDFILADISQASSSQKVYESQIKRPAMQS